MAQPARPNPSSRASEAIDTTLDFAVEILEATKDTIADALSVPGAGVALNVAIGLLNKVQEAKSNRNALESLREETKSLAQTLVRLGKIVQTALHEYPTGSSEDKQTREAIGFANVVERTNQLANDLQAIYDETGKLIKRNRFCRFVHSKGDARIIADMKERIELAHRGFQIEGGVTTEAMVTVALSDIKSVIAEQKFAEEERILSSIPRADEAHFLSSANKMKTLLQEGTRKKIFESLEQWVEAQSGIAGSDAELIRVLVGEAGTGKSSVAAELAKRLKMRGCLGALFFFTRGLPDLNSPKKFFPTIAWQLARSQPALREPVVDAARNHLETGTLQQLERQFEDLLAKPLSTVSPSHPPIFVIVDGLDECTEEGPQLVPSLLRLLLSAAVRPRSPLRVFLASRPDPQYIHDAFTTSDVKSHVSVISMRDFRDSVDHDIDRFIRATLTTHPTSKEWSDTRPYIVATMVTKSDGLFVYARTAIDFILSDLNDPMSMQERYDLLMTIDCPGGLDRLYTLYFTVLESEFPRQDRYPQRQERLKQILVYLVTLRVSEGISPATLEKLTCMPTTHSVPILNKLRSVVLFERDNVHSPFRIIHASFRDFLVDPSRTSEAFYVSMEQVKRVHRSLADDCRRMMRLLRAKHYRRFTQVALLHQVLARTLPEVEEPHFIYIAKHFSHHHFTAADIADIKDEHQYKKDMKELLERDRGDEDMAIDRVLRCLPQLRHSSGVFVSCIEVLTHTKATMSTAAVAEIQAIGKALDIANKIVNKIWQSQYHPVEAEVLVCREVISCADTLERLSHAMDAALDNHPATSSEKAEAEEASGSLTLLERVETLTRDLQEVSVMVSSTLPWLGRHFYGVRDPQPLIDITDKITLAKQRFQIGVVPFIPREDATNGTNMV